MASVTIKGTLIKTIAPEQGVSAKTGKEWIRQTFIIEEASQRYHVVVAVTVFSREKIQQFTEYPPGSNVEVDCYVESRESSTGKWFSEVHGFAIRPLGAARYSGQQYQQPAPQPQYQNQPTNAQQFVQQYQQGLQQQGGQADFFDNYQNLPF